MSKYHYIEIAPSRSAYDPIYLTFENRITKEIIYRKALRWDQRPKEDVATQIVKHYIEMLKGERT